MADAEKRAVGRTPNSKHWFTTAFLQPLPYLVTPQVPENCQLTSSFFCWCSNSSKCVANDSNYIGRLFYVAMLLTPAQIKPKSFESRRYVFSVYFLIFYPGWMHFIFTSCECLGTRLLPQSYQYPKLSEGADRVAGQLRGDKECPFSGVTKSGRIWSKVPESDARSVECPFSGVTESGRVWRKVSESYARSVERPFSGVTESGRVWRKVPKSDAGSVGGPTSCIRPRPSAAPPCCLTRRVHNKHALSASAHYADTPGFPP